MTGFDTTLVIVLVCLLATGIALYFVGFLVVLATALGNRRWFWGLGIFIFPLLALPYCLLNREITAWPFKLLLVGVGAILLAVVLSFVFIPQLYAAV